MNGFLKATAIGTAQELGVMNPAVTDFASENSEGFLVDLKVANLNIAKGVNAAIQRQAIENNAFIETALLPGAVRVFWKKR